MWPHPLNSPTVPPPPPPPLFVDLALSPLVYCRADPAMSSYIHDKGQQSTQLIKVHFSNLQCIFNIARSCLYHIIIRLDSELLGKGRSSKNHLVILAVGWGVGRGDESFNHSMPGSICLWKLHVKTRNSNDM